MRVTGVTASFLETYRITFIGKKELIMKIFILIILTLCLSCQSKNDYRNSTAILNDSIIKVYDSTLKNISDKIYVNPLIFQFGSEIDSSTIIFFEEMYHIDYGEFKDDLTIFTNELMKFYNFDKNIIQYLINNHDNDLKKYKAYKENPSSSIVGLYSDSILNSKEAYAVIMLTNYLSYPRKVKTQTIKYPSFLAKQPPGLLDSTIKKDFVILSDWINRNYNMKLSEMRDQYKNAPPELGIFHFKGDTLAAKILYGKKKVK